MTIIYKNIQCLSCHNCASHSTDKDGTTIICALEIDAIVVDATADDKCPSYVGEAGQGELDATSDEPQEEQEVPEDQDNQTEGIVLEFVFVADGFLSKLNGPKKPGQKTIKVTEAFARWFNKKLDESRKETQLRMAALEAEMETNIDAAVKAMLEADEVGEQGDHPGESAMMNVVSMLLSPDEVFENDDDEDYDMNLEDLVADEDDDEDDDGDFDDDYGDDEPEMAELDDDAPLTEEEEELDAEMAVPSDDELDGDYAEEDADDEDEDEKDDGDSLYLEGDDAEDWEDEDDDEDDDVDDEWENETWEEELGEDDEDDVLDTKPGSGGGRYSQGKG